MNASPLYHPYEIMNSDKLVAYTKSNNLDPCLRCSWGAPKKEKPNGVADTIRVNAVMNKYREERFRKSNWQSGIETTF